MKTDFKGRPLVPGVNVDKVDVRAGLKHAIRFGYGGPEHLMVAEYALRRHARGEEDGAQRTALSGGIDLTSWYAILAAALAMPALDEPVDLGPVPRVNHTCGDPDCTGAGPDPAQVHLKTRIDGRWTALKEKP